MFVNFHFILFTGENKVFKSVIYNFVINNNCYVVKNSCFFYFRKQTIFTILLLGFYCINIGCGQEPLEDTTPRAIVEFENVTITAEVAESGREKARGLSNRQMLGEGEGMLFVFDDNIIPSFGMQNMLFPIDIVWILNDTVVDFSEDLPVPFGYQEAGIVVKPDQAVNYVLELNSGFVKKHSLQVGDNVNIVIVS